MSTVATITDTNNPPNGETNYTLDVACSNGVRTYSAFSGTINCDASYTLSGSTCVSTSYTVTFDSQGGSAVVPASKSVNSGSTVGTLPTDPTRSGYSFSGWYTAPTAGTQVTASTVVTSNIAAYAQWNAVSAFTTVWKVGTAGYGDGTNTITFNVSGTGNITIDWGDGTAIQIVTSGTVSHTYASVGDKTVRINGLNQFYNPSI